MCSFVVCDSRMHVNDYRECVIVTTRVKLISDLIRPTTKLTIYRAHSLILHVQLITVISSQRLTRHSQLVTMSNRHNGQLVTCDELAV